MNLNSHATQLFFITIIAIVGIIVLAATHTPIPAVLDALAGGAAFGGAALAKS